MGTRLHPGCDAFEKMSREELLWWIRNEIGYRKPAESKILWMRWIMKTEEHDRLSKIALLKMNRYNQRPMISQTQAGWNAIRRNFDKLHRMWEECERMLAQYKEVYANERVEQ